ncbi:hypothetical protein Theco_1727 [Thermobacillus composti KWC4]|uniref:N-acetyltransferase domain-containing protein n=1 Tax=Thermobacillus composti (strain DSM 18247 / JCM 13945 / KWC4) TaxID=717605 RepID=L0EE26_THECK|nr:hypothetical protein [Thermobacillus composti]AGA57859.1 hypothetical protein Theco_1727 [Thermobacillus composti KWC4]
MEYVRLTSIRDPLFKSMHELLGRIFPKEEVLAFELWEEPLRDEGIYVYAAVHEGEVVGATEYRYYADMRVAVTDFTAIGREGLGIGRFLAENRRKHLERLAAESRTSPLGMFAEIYDPRKADIAGSGLTPMHPYVRREVLSHLGYRKLDLDYVHPSWDHEGNAVTGLDLCFMPADERTTFLPASLVAAYLERYYAALPNRPDSWYAMMDGLRKRAAVDLLPL